MKKINAGGKSLSDYKNYYLSAILAVVLTFIAPMFLFNIAPDIAGPIQMAGIVLLITSAQKINKLPNFENKKSISKLVIVWCILIVVSTVRMVYLLSDDINYLYNDDTDILSLVIGIVIFVIDIIIVIRCIKNIRNLKKPYSEIGINTGPEL